MARVGKHYFRMLFLCIGSIFLSVQPSVSQNIPGAQRLDLNEAPDGGRLIPEYAINAGGGGFSGLATFYSGRPVIFYDIVWIQRFGGFETSGFRFLRAHEYGHHRLNHGLQQLNSPPQMLPVLGYNSELEADCWAMRTLKRNGDQEAIRAAFYIYQNVLPPQDAQGRPGAANRTANMNRCLN
jgi:hypothetical protein